MENKAEKIKLLTFTDPMMGLSYECEPIFRKLETHFPGEIEFRYVMSGLVRNVYDFVDPVDLPNGGHSRPWCLSKVPSYMLS